MLIPACVKLRRLILKNLLRLITVLTISTMTMSVAFSSDKGEIETSTKAPMSLEVSSELSPDAPLLEDMADNVRRVCIWAYRYDIYGNSERYEKCTYVQDCHYERVCQWAYRYDNYGNTERYESCRNVRRCY